MNTSTSRAIAAAALVLASAAAFTGCKAKAAAAAEQKWVSVSIDAPKQKDVHGLLLLNGIIHTKSEVDIVAETSGKVVKVFFDTGMRVAKGDVLAQLEDDVKLAAFNAAKAASDKAASDLAKAESLYQQKVISDSDLQGYRLAMANVESQLLVSRRDYEKAKLATPQNGVVTQKNVTVGTILSLGAKVAHVVDIENLVMTVQVGERDILKLYTGMAVSVEPDVYQGKAVVGKVSSISPKGDAALTFPVEIAFSSDQGKPLYDGMSAKASIDLGQKRILAVPRSAVVGIRESPQVFIVDGGTARLRPVVLGPEYGTDVEVVSGIGVPDRIVVAGMNNLNDGSKIEIVQEPAK